MNRILCFLVISVAGVCAASGGYGSIHHSEITSSSPATDDYQINVLETYTIDYAYSILGITAAGDAILFVDGSETGEKLYVADIWDLAYAGEFDLSWSNALPFGVAYDGILPYVNDFGDGLIRYGFDFSSSFTNPFDTEGRGMDYDGTDIWEVSGGGTTDAMVGKFNTSGGGFQSWNLPGVDLLLSGMTLYTIAGSTGIAVTAYDAGATDHFIWFYEFDGSACTLLGSAEIPSNSVTTGLAYSSYTETWFVAYLDGDWKISEFEVEQTALARTTWGNIKTMF